MDKRRFTHNIKETEGEPTSETLYEKLRKVKRNHNVSRTRSKVKVRGSILNVTHLSNLTTITIEDPKATGHHKRSYRVTERENFYDREERFIGQHENTLHNFIT